MQKVKLGEKNLSKREKDNYYNVYGVVVKENSGCVEFSGESSNIQKVKDMVKRDVFLANNNYKVGKYESQEGSMSSKLQSYEKTPDYSLCYKKKENNSGYHSGRKGLILKF